MALTVGMIGLDHPHSAGHLRTFDALEEVESVAVYDEQGRSQSDLSEYGPKISAAYDDVDALLERPDVPVVAIAMRNDVAPLIVEKAATAGKHILCEKPCARSFDEMAKALDAIADHDVTFSPYYVGRANPAMIDMRDLITGGALGRLTSFELRMVTTQVKFRDPNHWLFNANVAGGGILSWLGCHWIDALRYLTGHEVVSVTAFADTVGDSAVGVEDVASVAMRLSGGALGTFHAGYLLPSGRAGYEGARFDRLISLRGTLGTISYVELGRHEIQLQWESTSEQWGGECERSSRYAMATSPAYGGAHGVVFVKRFLRAALCGDVPGFASEHLSAGIG